MKNLTRVLFAVVTLGSMAFAAMNGPAGLAVDSNGNLYVANFNANSVQVYNTSHQLINTISAGMSKPYGIAVDGLGTLHVANFGNNTVTLYNSYGNWSNTIKGLVQPIYLTADELGNTWVVDKNLSRLTVWDFYNVKVRTMTASTSKLYSMYLGVAERSGFLVMATNGSPDSLYTDSTSEILGLGKSLPVPTVIPTPCAVAFGRGSTEYVATLQHQVYSSSDFIHFFLFASLTYAPSGIAVDRANGFVYFSNNVGNSVDVFDTNGNYLTTMN